MKKFYAFFAAALISVCAFASREEVPSNAVLANYYEQGQVCVCIYVPENLKCYDIVFVGTYNDWTADAAKCAKFQPVENYDGWYVVAVDDDGLPEDPEKEPYADIEGKPVQLDPNGEFFWKFQIGEATKISGGAEIVEGGVKGEIDIKNYGTDAPNIYTVDGWQVDPCTVEYKSYSVAVINDGCAGFAIPFIIGGFNNWKFAQMQVDEVKTIELGAGYYYFNLQAVVGEEFQIVSGLMDQTGTIVEQPAWADAAYLQELVDGKWVRINGGANFKLGDQTEVVFDIRVDTLQWARCDETPTFEVTVALKAPAGAPEAGIELVGAFEKDGWGNNPVTMTWNPSTGYFDGTVAAAKATQAFKFRETGNWDNQILYYEGGTEEEPLDLWLTFGDGHKDLLFGDFWGEGETKAISLDFSNPDEFKWQVPAEEGIEEIVLTEKARKVVVDGQLYIVRDNKLFNVTGTQVR